MRMHGLAERTDGIVISRTIRKPRILLPVGTRMRPASLYSLDTLLT